MFPLAVKPCSVPIAFERETEEIAKQTSKRTQLPRGGVTRQDLQSAGRGSTAEALSDVQHTAAAASKDQLSDTCFDTRTHVTVKSIEDELMQKPQQLMSLRGFHDFCCAEAM